MAASYPTAQKTFSANTDGVTTVNANFADQRDDEIEAIEAAMGIYPSGGKLASGTYTPTLTNTTNVASSTAFVSQYMRVGNVVTCGVRVEIDVTAATATVLGISLPIASAISSAIQVCGVGADATGMSGEVRGNVAGDRAEFAYVSTVTANNAFYLTFTYLIL